MKGISCSKAEEWILRDLDEDLLVYQREALEAHVRECESCHRFRLDVNEVITSVATDAPEDPGEDFWKMYQVSLEAKLREKELTPKVSLGWGWKAAGALLAAFLVIILVRVGMWQESTPEWGNTQQMSALFEDLTRLYGPIETEDSYDDAVGEHTLATAYSEIDPERLRVAPWFEVEEESNHLIL